MYTTLIEAANLLPHLDDPAWAVVDCRFALSEPGRGRRDYPTAHIPGAVYAHLDEDLSAPVEPGVTGRHPLPDATAFAATLSAWGIGEGVQVVAYDDASGGVAARLWWMLRWLGHPAAAVLNGGWAAWQAGGHPERGGTETRASRPFTPRPRPEMTCDVDAVDAIRTDPSWCLLDARAAERYRGEVEPIDPVAGHIPGARSVPYAGNLGTDGRFLPPDRLRARYAEILGSVPPENAVCYCGSGVTAAHDVLAMAHAGFEGARLYPGSWSHWITDPGRPIGVGARP